jgi:RIO-like serine/threonine protein kinase
LSSLGVGVADASSFAATGQSEKLNDEELAVLRAMSHLSHTHYFVDGEEIDERG